MKFKNIKKKTYKKKSPSISRSIPDFAKATLGKPASFKFSLPKINNVALVKIYGTILKIFVALIFVVAVIIVGFDFQNNLRLKQKIDSQREILIRELKFWEDFISKQQNYADAYFQVSSLEYRLGSTLQAKIDVEKGLALDPNSQSGKKIEELLSR